MPKSFLIVEDHPIFADALAGLLRECQPTATIASAATLREGLDELLRSGGFDIVFLDLWLPDSHGLDGLLALRRDHPKLPVVVVSAFDDESVVHRALVCGAAGFISKSADRRSMASDIVEVLEGNVVRPQVRAGGGAGIAAGELAALTERLKSLTQQQHRVLQMLCQGLLNKQIAFELGVGETTVKAHVSEIFRKLSVASRTQAVLEVSRLNLGAVLPPSRGARSIDEVHS